MSWNDRNSNNNSRSFPDSAAAVGGRPSTWLEGSERMSEWLLLPRCIIPNKYLGNFFTGMRLHSPIANYCIFDICTLLVRLPSSSADLSISADSRSAYVFDFEFTSTVDSAPQVTE
eukprot:g32965.t1